jgi:hypothetical protein
MGAAIRQVEPAFAQLGGSDPDVDRRLGKALSRKARKSLEAPARAALRQQGPVDPAAVLAGARMSGDRAGLLLCGDAGVALSVVLREEAGRGADSPAAIAGALASKAELQDLVRFALSDEHFALRARLKMSVA